jgi:hypothetical protein
MGLFDKALHELEAGRPKSGAGLFAKAQKTLNKGKASPGGPANEAGSDGEGLSASAPPSPGPRAQAAKAKTPARPEVILVETEEPSLDLEPSTEAEAPPIQESSTPDWPATLGEAPPEAQAEAGLPLDAAIDAGLLGSFEPTEADLAAIDVGEAFVPFSAEDLAALASEVKALPRGFDSLFSAFSRISEALPLAELSLFSCEGRLLRPIAAIGRALPTEPHELVEPAILRSLAPGAELCPGVDQGLAQLAAYIGEGSHRVFVHNGPDGKPFALWSWSDPVLNGGGALGEAFVSLLESSPIPQAKIEFVRPVKPEVAAQRIRLGQGKAVAILYDMAAYVSQTAILIPGLDESALINLCRTVVSTILGAEGAVFLLTGSRLLAVLYSKAVPDSELAVVQLRKSIARTLPFLGTADFPLGRATTLDLASAQAVEIIELFASE